MDPLDFADLEGLRDYIQTLGFGQTHYGQLYHTGYFRKEIHRIHEADPDARFVLIGFSFGANMVRDLTLDAQENGIPVALLFYLGGNTLKNIPRDQPENAERVVNILASGCIWNGAWMDRAENYHERGVWHFGSPTHPNTIAALTRHLAEIGASITYEPKPEPVATAMYQDEPTPRAVAAVASDDGAEWDFLKPVAALRMPDESQPIKQAMKRFTTEHTETAERKIEN
jgi:hypothetical protein